MFQGSVDFFKTPYQISFLVGGWLWIPTITRPSPHPRMVAMDSTPLRRTLHQQDPGMEMAWWKSLHQLISGYLFLGHTHNIYIFIYIQYQCIYYTIPYICILNYNIRLKGNIKISSYVSMKSTCHIVKLLSLA